jgi:hypothetical protein
MKYIKLFEKFQPIITGDRNDPAINGHKIYVDDVTSEMKNRRMRKENVKINEFH